MKLVSIIITTKNSGHFLEALLKSLKDQSYKKIEIIVIDNNSTDNTKSIAQKFTKKVFNKGPERSVQRNFGAKKAVGDYFLFLDSDMVLTKNVIEGCVKKFNKRADLGGLIIPEKSFGEGFWVKAKILERKINEGEPYFEAARFFPAAIFKEIRGYDKNLTGPEDWDLPQRISKKYKIERIKQYIHHNEGKHTLMKLAKKKFYYGLSAHKYLTKHNINPISQKTVYILRPAFYKKLDKIVEDPILYLGMWLMLLAETIGGGMGYMMGRIKNGK